MGKEKRNYFMGCALILMLVTVVAAGIYTVGKLYRIHKDTYYPSCVMDEGELCPLAKKMEGSRYRELRGIVEDLAEGGNGFLIFPDGYSTSFRYGEGVLAKLSTSTGTGRIVVAEGTGNIQEDIVSHTGDYYAFIGHVDPCYDEKVYECGSSDNYHATYSAGYLTSNNFFKRKGFYIIAFEYRANDEKNLFLSYSTEYIRELEENVDVLQRFAGFALQGDTEPETTGEDAESSKPLERIADLSEYISEKYNIPEGEAGSVMVSGNTVSGNGMGADEDIPLEVVE